MGKVGEPDPDREEPEANAGGEGKEHHASDLQHMSLASAAVGKDDDAGSLVVVWPVGAAHAADVRKRARLAGPGAAAAGGVAVPDQLAVAEGLQGKTAVGVCEKRQEEALW